LISRTRILHMLRKEFIQIFRDPRMRTIIFVVPLVQMFVFAYAATTDVVNIPMAVYDLDGTPASRELVSKFEGTGLFRIAARIADENQAEKLLDHGAVSIVLHIAHGYGAALKAGKAPQVQVLVDGTDSNTGGVVLQYGSRIITEYSRDLLESAMKTRYGAAAAAPGVTLETRSWFNENLHSRWHFLPGLMMILVTLISLLLTGMAVVREKEIGTIEQIIVTPITRLEFILGKTLPFAIIGYADMAIVVAVATGWFRLPVRGNLLLIVLAVACYLLCTLSIGLYISTISETQQQALMSTFLFMFPAVLLSGFMFPIANMPEPVQWLTAVNPMRYFLLIIRTVFLKGVGLDVLWPQYASLFALGIAIASFAISRFRKSMN